tara:strand:+ start:182 stop:490 length:309 start_codon:yes stop_codon:yes gene_type:complete
MRVGEATPGQILYAVGRAPKAYLKNMDPDEIKVCEEAGFVPAFLMPSWIHGPNEAPTMSALFYVGPVRLSKSVGGLRRYHIFLFNGIKWGIQGYDFRCLDPA